MADVAPGFYRDPFDTATVRRWDGEKWTQLTRTASGETAAVNAPHVGKSEPVPTSRAATEPASTPAPRNTVDAGESKGAMILAAIWAAVALVVGIMTIAGASTEEYGGDAYTGIQNATAQVVRAVGWLIIATGALGLIIARSRR